MKRGRSTGKPTKAESARMDAIKEGGDVIAYALGLGFVPCEVHHLTTGGKHGQKRLGHMKTVGLNQWSHRGVPFDGWDATRWSRDGSARNGRTNGYWNCRKNS